MARRALVPGDIVAACPHKPGRRQVHIADRLDAATALACGVLIPHTQYHVVSPVFVGKGARRRTHGRATGPPWWTSVCAAFAALSGPAADAPTIPRRPMDHEWAAGIWRQCLAADVPFFFKQAMVDGEICHAPTLEGRTWRQLPRLDAG
jgi:hypothetical protein